MTARSTLPVLYPVASQAALYGGSIWEVTEPCNCGCAGHVRLARSTQPGWTSTPAVHWSEVTPLTPTAHELLQVARRKR